MADIQEPQIAFIPKELVPPLSQIACNLHIEKQYNVSVIIQMFILGSMDVRPLAERMRPETLAEVLGQEHLVAAGKIIH